MLARRGPRLGRKTLAQLIEYLHERHTWSSLQQFLFKHGLDQQLTGSTKLSALGNVFHPIVSTEDEDEIRKALEALEEITTDLYRKVKEWEGRPLPDV